MLNGYTWPPVRFYLRQIHDNPAHSIEKLPEHNEIVWDGEERRKLGLGLGFRGLLKAHEEKRIAF